MVFLRLLQKAKGEAAAYQVAHVGNGAFVGRHEDEVVLEFADLAIRSFVLEDLGNVGRRLTQVGRHGSRFVIHDHEQRATVADFVGHFIRTGRGKHGVEFAARQAEKLADALGQFGADVGSVDVPHGPANDHGEVRLHHEAQRSARAVIQIDGIGDELHAGLLDE